VNRLPSTREKTKLFSILEGKYNIQIIFKERVKQKIIFHKKRRKTGDYEYGPSQFRW
jgi:hypothetical protein